MSAWTDFRTSLAQWRVWAFFAWNDIRLRYRRTALGPFWVTASMGIMIASLALVYPALFRQDPATYLPYMSSGIVVWALIATTVSEGCSAIFDKADIYKNIQQPYFHSVYRVVVRNLIVFGHNLVIFGAAALWYGVDALSKIPLLAAGLAAFAVNAVWIVLFLATVSARFRDIPPLVGSVLTILLLVTPVFWPKEMLGNRTHIVWLNPFAHLLDLIRAPLLGQSPPIESFAVVGGMAVLGWAMTMGLFAVVRKRIVYWL
jgi:ABC-type polysaccharide/polyol phosphate export permease